MMNVIEKLKMLGYNTIAQSWYDRIDVWNSWYKEKVDSFHVYTVWNGQKKLKCDRYSLGMAKKVSEDWANLLMNEKVKITLEGSKEQSFIDEVFTRNNFEVCMNELQEKGAARGTYAIVPHVTGATINANGKVAGADGIDLDYITAECIFPLSWKGRNIKECAFATVYNVDSNKYLYMQLHVLQGSEYVIINKLFKDNNDTLQEVRFGDVHGFDGVTDAPILTGSENPLFVVGRYNIANNIEDNNPMGIAVFANSIDVLKGIDVAYDSYVNEFVLGKKRVMVKPSATKNIDDGDPVFDPTDMAYYVLPEDISGGTIIQQIDMTLRTAEHQQGIQDLLNLLSTKCGFGEQHYKFDQGSVATATQIISENSDMFRTIKKHEILLEKLLIDLCRILLRLGNTMGRGLNEEVEISVDFDDSIIEDKVAERANDRQDLAAGIMNAYEYRMKWYNEDEVTAKAALPGMEDMTDEGQDEVE